jgi:L-fucose isomerase-like protein
MRIATIGLCDPGYSEVLAAARHAASVAILKRSVDDIVDAGLQPDEFRSQQALSVLRKQHAEIPFDALFLIQAAWARPAVLLQVIRSFPTLPMVLYSPGSPVAAGVIRSIAPAAGAGAALHVLRRHGIKFKYVWSAPGKPIDTSAWMPFLRAAGAVRKLRGTKLGMVGFGDMRLQSTGFDVQEVHETFGVEVESRDMLELQTEMDALSRNDVAQQLKQLTAAWVFEGKAAKPEALAKVVAMFMVLDRWAGERGYIGLSIKCPTGVAARMGITPCLAGCLLARKYHYVCENDVPGLLGQVILGLLSDQMSTYWEFYEIFSDSILFGCCGFCPECYLSEPVRVRTFEGFLTGMACCSRVRNGDYTIARLGKNPDGRYGITCSEGKTSDPPPWCEDCLGEPQHPSVRFTPEVPVAEFMAGVLAQHVAAVPGRWSEALGEFKKIAGIA